MSHLHSLYVLVYYRLKHTVLIEVGAERLSSEELVDLIVVGLLEVLETGVLLVESLG